MGRHVEWSWSWLPSHWPPSGRGCLKCQRRRRANQNTIAHTGMIPLLRHREWAATSCLHRSFCRRALASKVAVAPYQHGSCDRMHGQPRSSGRVGAQPVCKGVKSGRIQDAFPRKKPREANLTQQKTTQGTKLRRK